MPRFARRKSRGSHYHRGRHHARPHGHYGGRSRYTKSRAHHTKRHHRKTHKGSSASFAARVLQAIAKRSTLILDFVSRISWLELSQYSTLAAGPSDTLWPALNTAQHIISVLQQYADDDEAAPFTASTGAGRDALEFWILGATVQYQLYNVNQYTVECCLYVMVARYDGGKNPSEAYGDDITLYSGSNSATGHGIILPQHGTILDTDNGSTPFVYRALTQLYKIKKVIRFKLQPGGFKNLKFHDNRKWKISERFGGVNQIGHRTMYFHLNAKGPMMDSSLDKTVLQLPPGSLNESHTVTYNWSVMPQPARTIDFQTLQNTSLGHPSFMVINQPTVETSFATS